MNGLNISDLTNKQINTLIGNFDESQLQSYIDKIQEIRETANEIFANSPEDQQGLDIGQYEEFANALEGVEDSQAAILLSTQGLTNAQIQQTLSAKGLSTELQYQAMVEAGLLGTKQKLSNVELQSILASQLGSEAKAKATMTSMGLSVAIEGEEVQTVKLTAKKLEQAVADGILTKEEAQLLAMTTGVTIAQKTQIGSVMPKWIANMKAMALATWEQVKATVAWLATTPAGWATLAIGGIVGVITAISKHNKKAEEAKQKIKELGEEARNAVNEINSNLESTKSTVESVKDRYAELAQGVKNLGKVAQSQGTLSTDEYNEFLDISNQLADLFPELTVGYDDNGNAILRLNGNVQTITSSLNDLVSAQEKLASKEIADQMDDIFNDYSLTVNGEDGYSAQYNEILNQKKALDEYYTQIINTGITDGFSGLSDETLTELRTQLENFGIDLDDFYNKSIMGKSFTQEEIDAIKAAFTIIGEEYQKELDGLSTKIDAENKQFSSYLISSFKSNSLYQTISDKFGTEGTNLVNSILTNSGYDTLLAEAGGDWKKAEQYLEDNILTNFTDLSDEEVQEFQSVYAKLLEIDPDKALAENIPLIKEYVNKLAELLQIDAEQIEIAFGVDLKADEDLLNKARDKFAYKDNPSNIEDVKLNAEIDSFVNSLNEKEAQLLLDAEIPDSVRKGTREDWENFISELSEESVIDLQVRTSTDAVDSFADIKSALSSLDDIYSQTVLKNATGDSIANGFASPDTINAVESAFGGIAEEDAKVSAALEDFENTLIKFPNDADKAQQAIDNLITTYIDQTDILQDLTEENKEYAKAQLKAMGISNADEVVESRLTQTNKELSEGYSKLADNVKKYNESVKNSDYQKQKDEIQNITNKLNEMYKTGQRDVNGNEVLPFDTDTVLKNMDTIQAATQGDIDAMTKLAIMAGKTYIAHLQIDGDTYTVDAMKNNLYQLLDTFNGANIAIGTSMDNSPIIQGLNAIGKQAGMTANEIAEMIKKASGGTISADMDYTETKVDLPVFKTVTNAKGQQITVRAGYDANKQTIRIPRWKYTYKGAGGAPAHYTGGSSASSSGGSGGGGGGSSPSSEPQTFDWIETAIDRAEENVNRLDKTVSNVYDNWSKRNKALTDEIGTIRYEIGLQQAAYQGYMNKANSLGLSEEYKQKVYNGAIQIEDIADEDLAKKVSEFKQWYEKALACQDAIQDLNITLGELAQTKFDNVEKEFSDLIDIIETQSDIIDEKISNIEERGYFASSELYRQQIAYEQQVLNNLNSEYSSLVTKRDEAVRDGSIKQGSEQYQDMTKTILDVQKAIEESKTSIIELNNAIRDLNWEVFDYAQERISKITDEANFLIDAFSNYDLYNENGTFNDKANATAYLHGKNYEVYLQQSKDYAEEIKKINADLARDPSNKDLIERREELLDLQQESISNIYAEKNAIKSLVEEGINRHLEALSEMIDKYKESLNSAKDLYDYQKNISSQVKEIGNYQKMIMAYSGDNSEESKKLIQEYQNKLKDAETNLQETQWDRMISETDTLLSNMYNDYSDLLNERLDNIDSLFYDVISGANANANMINSTIYNMANSLGYSINMLSQSIPSIKGNVFNGIKAYASGTSGVSYKHVAWTQDGGSEIIYRAKDGAILTPLNVGDKVFTHEMSENLWKMAQGNLEGLGANLIKIPDNISNNQTRTINNDNMISISLPNVTNYDEFKRDLQKDPKFVGFVQEVTLGRALGRNSLNKNRY